MSTDEPDYEKHPYASPRVAYSKHKGASIHDIENNTNPTNHDILLALFMFSDFTENQTSSLQKDVDALKAEVRRLRNDS